MPPEGETPAVQRASPGHPDWIATPTFDLCCFILSPLAGLAFLLVYPFTGPPLAIAAAALIGGPHYLASLTFYFWDDTRADHRQRWFVHYIAPVLILGGVALIAWLRLPAIIVLVIYFWNAIHVARQSCGILSIYRHRAGAFGARYKTSANAAIIATNLSMALWNTEWHPALHRLLVMPSPALPTALWLTSTAAAAVSLLVLARSIYLRSRAGCGPRAAELGFLATSLCLFHPYLWVRDNDLATLGMLLGHFIQYLGIVWLVNHRKLVPGAGSVGQRCVARLWRDWQVLLPVFITVGGMFLFLQLQLMAVSIALVLLHFYLDGIFWAFRRPAVRNAIAPYLTRGAGGTPAGSPVSTTAA